MGRLALIGGRGFEALSPWSAARPLQAAGAGNILDAGGYVVLARHGISSYRPPHRIDHAANLRAVLGAGCDRALAICSVGGLRESVGVRHAGGLQRRLAAEQVLRFVGAAVGDDDDVFHASSLHFSGLRSPAVDYNGTVAS